MIYSLNKVTHSYFLLLLLNQKDNKKKIIIIENDIEQYY